MKSFLRNVEYGEKKYQALVFICPGCKDFGHTGLHMLPINTTETNPAWDFDGNLEKPTVNPSILTGKDSDQVCHSFLRDGVFEFLGDCTHSLANQHVDIPDLPDWVVAEGAH
jgi:hypothetical protein